MKIIVEEEYGFKYWLWTVDGYDVSKKSLQEYFYNQTGVETFYSGMSNGGIPGQFIGEWKELEWEDYRNYINRADYDAYAHIHTCDDSSLIWKINEKV